MSVDGPDGTTIWYKNNSNLGEDSGEIKYSDHKPVSFDKKGQSNNLGFQEFKMSKEWKLARLSEEEEEWLKSIQFNPQHRTTKKTYIDLLDIYREASESELE